MYSETVFDQVNPVECNCDAQANTSHIRKRQKPDIISATFLFTEITVRAAVQHVRPTHCHLVRYLRFLLQLHCLCLRKIELLLTEYRPIITVGQYIGYYYQSGMNDLLIMKDLYYARICFKSVETLGDLH